MPQPINSAEYRATCSTNAAAALATTLAAGCPPSTSLARFGPVRAATGWPGSTSAVTSLIRFSVDGSSPLARLTTGTHGRTYSAAAVSTSRKPWEGTAITTTSAGATASSKDPVARSAGGSSKPGRYVPFTCSSLIWPTRSS